MTAKTERKRRFKFMVELLLVGLLIVPRIAFGQMAETDGTIPSQLANYLYLREDGGGSSLVPKVENEITAIDMVQVAYTAAPGTAMILVAFSDWGAKDPHPNSLYPNTAIFPHLLSHGETYEWFVVDLLIESFDTRKEAGPNTIDHTSLRSYPTVRAALADAVSTIFVRALNHNVIREKILRFSEMGGKLYTELGLPTVWLYGHAGQRVAITFDPTRPEGRYGMLAHPEKPFRLSLFLDAFRQARLLLQRMNEQYFFSTDRAGEFDSKVDPVQRAINHAYQSLRLEPFQLDPFASIVYFYASAHLMEQAQNVVKMVESLGSAGRNRGGFMYDLSVVARMVEDFRMAEGDELARGKSSFEAHAHLTELHEQIRHTRDLTAILGHGAEVKAVRRALDDLTAMVEAELSRIEVNRAITAYTNRGYIPLEFFGSPQLFSEGDRQLLDAIRGAKDRPTTELLLQRLMLERVPYRLR